MGSRNMERRPKAPCPFTVVFGIMFLFLGTAQAGEIIPKTTVNGHEVFGILFLFLLPVNCYGNLAGAI